MRRDRERERERRESERGRGRERREIEREGERERGGYILIHTFTQMYVRTTHQVPPLHVMVMVCVRMQRTRRDTVCVTMGTQRRQIVGRVMMVIMVIQIVLV